MKVVILAGGFGSRLSEETQVKPKPMVEIGGRPILWHIMKGFSHFGFDEFVVALGYKGDVIKRYFVDYHALSSDITVSIGDGSMTVHNTPPERWSVSLIDTGQATLTGSRIKRLRARLGAEAFLATYGDGVADLDVERLIAFHRGHGRAATVTAVRPPARFGGLEFAGDRVASFTEKPQIGEGWINGGFFVFEPAIFDYLEDEGSSLEVDVLERLAAEGQLSAYRHEGFWQCMDNLRDVRLLEALWESGDPPWRCWP